MTLFQWRFANLIKPNHSLMYLKKKKSVPTPAILLQRLDSGKLWVGSTSWEEGNCVPPPPGNLEAILLRDYDCAYVLLELGLMVLPFDCGETQLNLILEYCLGLYNM